MSFYALQQVDKAAYDRIARDYFAFIAASSNPDKEPIRVFSPLSEKMLSELELIREVSRDLQEKKVQEIAKQKADAEKIEEEKKEEEAESKTEGEDKTEEDGKREEDNTDDAEEEKENKEE